MMDLSVVVLPAPLRPIRHTISPLATSIEISCNTWLEPYQAFRLLTCNMRSVLPLAKIDALYRFIPANLLRRALREQLAMVQHQDTIADSKHQFHFVLDQNDRSFAGELHDQVHHGPGFLRTHSCGRLVQQEQTRSARQRHPDFERALLAMRKRLRRSLP